MDIEFKATITIYELLAIACSVLIPLAQWIYKKFLKKAKISYIPNNEIELFFNRSGNYFRVLASCLVEKKSIILKNVKVTIKRKKDGKIAEFLWSCFISTTFQNMPNGPFQPSEYVHPVMIDADSVKPLYLEVVPCSESDRLNIVDIHVALTNLCINKCNKNNADISYNDYINLKERKTLIETAKNCFYWKPGEYDFNVLLEYDDDSKFCQKMHFMISEDDSEKLKQNVYVIADMPYNNVWNKQSLMPSVLVKLKG